MREQMIGDTPPRYSRAQEALSASVADDFVALHVDRGTCFGMADVTADVWTMLEVPSTLDSLVDRLTELYEVGEAQCRAEIAALLDLMVQEGLVVVSQ